MAADNGEPQGEPGPDHCGFLYPARHFWADYPAARPAYLYQRCLAATIVRSLVWHNEFWRRRIPPDGGRCAFLGFYGPGHWPCDHHYFGPGGPDFWLFSRLGGRNTFAGEQCISGVAHVASRHSAGGLPAE